MTSARISANLRMGLPANDDCTTAVTDSVALRSLDVEARAAQELDTKQREACRLAQVRLKMALSANTRAMFLHHSRAALKHLRGIGAE